MDEGVPSALALVLTDATEAEGLLEGALEGDADRQPEPEGVIDAKLLKLVLVLGSGEPVLLSVPATGEALVCALLLSCGLVLCDGVVEGDWEGE